MENFALIFTALCLGYILQKTKALPEETPFILNRFILYISLPSIALIEIPKLTFSLQTLVPVGIAWSVMFASVVFILLLSRYLNFTREVKGSLLLVGVLANTSFLGIPLIQAYFGDQSLRYILMYDQLGTFIAFSLYGTFVAAYYSGHKLLNIQAVLRKIFTFPPFISLLIALLLMGNELPPLFTSVLNSFAATTVPLALISVGLQLKFTLHKHDRKPFALALFSILIFAPFVAFILRFFFGDESLAWDISIMEASMGPMITAGILASMWNLAPRLSNSVVGYGTLLSIITSFCVAQYLL